MDGLAFEDDQRHAAAGALLVIGRVGIGGCSVTMAECREVRLKDEAIPEFDLANRKGRQDQRELVVPGISSCGNPIRSEKYI